MSSFPIHRTAGNGGQALQNVRCRAVPGEANGAGHESEVTAVGEGAAELGIFARKYGHPFLKAADGRIAAANPRPEFVNRLPEEKSLAGAIVLLDEFDGRRRIIAE